MAALFDTTVAVLLLRRTAPEAAADLIRAARSEIRAGTALLPAAARVELLIGERTKPGLGRLATTLALVPTAILSAETASDAGSMGAYLAERGAPIPFPDLLIAATAIWLDIPLLTWDGDYARSRRLASEDRSDHPGAQLWRRLALHPTSRDA